MAEIKTTYEPYSGYAVIMAKFQPQLEEGLHRQIFKEIAKAIADRYVAENYAEIAKLLDQQAIATLSVAEAATKTRELLDQKLPERVETIVRERTKIYQRGILGGITRIG